MRTVLAVLCLALAMPALAHDEEHHKPSNHAKKGQHQDAPRSFDTKPAVGTWARCPVSGDVFRVGPETEMTQYEGRWYAFCCDECKPDFDKDPAHFADKKST
jgi:YHS domain-containing protein